MESLGLDLSKIPLDLILNILNIVLLFLIVRTLAYKPIRKFMDARTAKVNAAAAEAAEKAAEAEKIKAEYTEKMQAIESAASCAADEAKRKAQAEGAQILQDAQKEADAVLRKAENDAETIRADALQGMRDEVMDLAFGIGEKLLAHSIRDDDTKKLADRLFDERTGGGQTQ